MSCQPLSLASNHHHWPPAPPPPPLSLSLLLHAWQEAWQRAAAVCRALDLQRTDLILQRGRGAILSSRQWGGGESRRRMIRALHPAALCHSAPGRPAFSSPAVVGKVGRRMSAGRHRPAATQGPVTTPPHERLLGCEQLLLLLRRSRTRLAAPTLRTSVAALELHLQVLQLLEVLELVLALLVLKLRD